MFTLNDLLDYGVECQGNVKVLMIMGGDGEVKEVFNGNDLRQIPYGIGCKELAYIYSECDGSESCTCYEVNQE